ncbi:hypothetical protein PHMEG_00036798 [Phytophthora megakarya]|uniref:Uncharacterized protein n=1 Tax=Phytophthora megakarya TaxID=4795 RepID=A0A225UNJ9_9STRA|nr:hypothetical protein PHMEG_00036798 [Phytophthora megakarya]
MILVRLSACHPKNTPHLCIFIVEGKSRQNSSIASATVPPRGVTRQRTEVGPVVPVESQVALTPCQRMAQLLATRASKEDNTIESVEGLLPYARGTARNDNISIRMKLLWVSDHTYGQWKLVRLHFVDAGAPEPLQNMLNVFFDRYDDNRQDVDSLLFTATIWSMENDSDFLPPPGAIVTIKEYSNLQVLRDSQCQLTTKIGNLSWE